MRQGRSRRKKNHVKDIVGHSKGRQNVETR